MRRDRRRLRRLLGFEAARFSLAELNAAMTAIGEGRDPGTGRAAAVARDLAAQLRAIDEIEGYAEGDWLRLLRGEPLIDDGVPP